MGDADQSGERLFGSDFMKGKFISDFDERNLMMKRLYCGDNLDILRNHVDNESIDLIYIDPPFNSKSIYKTSQGIKAFDDTWHWNERAQEAYNDLIQTAPHPLVEMVKSFRSFLGEMDLMAYLVNMALRLVELHRALKPTGSFYLHCDPTASHYLKIILDQIFGVKNFRNEIIWVRSTNPKGSQHKSQRFSPFTDTIFYYAKTGHVALNLERIRIELSEEDIQKKYHRIDSIGRYYDAPILRSASMGERPNLIYEYKDYTPSRAGWRMEKEKLEKLDKQGNLGWSASGKPFRKLRADVDRGNPVGSFWNDISLINSQAKERLGYPTQKPEALLERIIKASSNEGDTVLDAFCGAGTTIAIAQRLNRKWIGIDMNPFAISLTELRLKIDKKGA